jgi:hypothetical protein
MSTAYCERTVFLATGDTSRIGEALTQLFFVEGMAIIARPKERRQPHYEAMMFGSMQHNTWGVAIIPGKGIWSAVKAAPLDLLLERSPISDQMRFVELCKLLRCQGFLIDVYDGGSGQVLVEVDEKGRVELSGRSFHDDYDISDNPEKLFDFYGTPIAARTGYQWTEDEFPPPINFGLLPHLQYLLDRSRNGECAIRADSDEERFCNYVAEELIGPNAEYCQDWPTIQCLRLFKALPIKQVLVNYYSWPDQDRLEPGPSPHEMKIAILKKNTRIYDKHGFELHPGDIVSWPAKGISATYEGFGTVNDAQGNPQISRYTSLKTIEGKYLPIEVAEIEAVLEFVSRSAD